MPRKGFRQSASHRKKIGRGLKGKYTEEKSGRWKGADASLVAKRQRIRRLYGKPRYCEICKSTKKEWYEWANKDHKYSMEKEDWMRVCRGCHMEYDFELGHRMITEETKQKISKTEKLTKNNH